jgi:hypothetical protein
MKGNIKESLGDSRRFGFAEGPLNLSSFKEKIKNEAHHSVYIIRH